MVNSGHRACAKSTITSKKGGFSFMRTTQHNTTRTSFDKNKGTKKTRMATHTHIHTHTRKAKMFIYIIAFSYQVGYSDEERGGRQGEKRGGEERGEFGPISTFIVWRSVIPEQRLRKTEHFFYHYYLFFLSLSLFLSLFLQFKPRMHVGSR